MPCCLAEFRTSTDSRMHAEKEANLQLAAKEAKQNVPMEGQHVAAAMDSKDEGDGESSNEMSSSVSGSSSGEGSDGDEGVGE